jgi:dienelactone hydrolase
VKLLGAILVLTALPGAALAGPLARRARSVLGDDGPAMADRVLAAVTPGCPEFETAEQAQTWSDRVRRNAIDSIGIDLRRKVVSVDVQRTLENPEYRMEIARIEVFPGVYMPANIYIPNEPDGKKMPLVITPVACNADSWSSRAQQRSANLARLGIVVITTDGFCGNGLRATLADSNRHIGYGRQLLGMRSISFSAYLQELISTITWALDYYPFLEPKQIGAVGSSYGGQVALLLAQLDTRVQSVSVAGTYLGEPCDGYPLKSDIHMNKMRPPHVWLAPVEVPVQPVNWRLLTVFPRAVHVTSGEADMSAPPNVIGGAMSYARSIYALAGLEERIEYATDSGKHSYNPRRRQSARTWMSRTLLGDATPPPAETIVPVRAWELLAADISGTKTLHEEMQTRIEREVASRFDDVPPERVRANVTSGMKSLFPEAPWKLEPTTVYEHNRGGITVKGYRMRAKLLSFPVVIVESNNGRKKPGGTALYLPKQGTQAEFTTITGMLQHYDRVVSIDYLGIGELESGRLRLHTLARYLMHNDPSLPGLDVALLRSWVAGQTGEKFDVWATNWPTSFFAVALKWLEPNHIDKVYLQGVPINELRYLQSRKKIPDLLLWAGLFDKISVRELSVAIGDGVKHVR